jgi:hypothetical protein
MGVIWLVVAGLALVVLTGLIPSKTGSQVGSNPLYHWPRHGSPLVFQWARYREGGGELGVRLGVFGYQLGGCHVTRYQGQLWVLAAVGSFRRGFVIAKLRPQFYPTHRILAHYPKWDLFLLADEPNPDWATWLETQGVPMNTPRPLRLEFHLEFQSVEGEYPATVSRDIPTISTLLVFSFSYKETREVLPLDLEGVSGYISHQFSDGVFLVGLVDNTPEAQEKVRAAVQAALEGVA